VRLPVGWERRRESLKGMVPAPSGYLFFHLVLRSYDCYTYFACQLVFITVLISEQCSQFERVILKHVQMVNKTSNWNKID